MHDLVAVAVELENGRTAYFLTWGKIQDDVEQVVLDATGQFKLPAPAVRASLCPWLRDAAAAPAFYEYYFDFCQKTIPRGDEYEAWRADMDARMREGREIAYIGTPESMGGLRKLFGQ